MAEEEKRPPESKQDKEAKKAITEDVETFFKDVWGKVVEYASLGAEEATKVSVTAKTRVDIETLKFKKGKMLKLLGDRYYEEVAADAKAQVKGTRDIIKQVKAIDREIKGLEKDMARAAKSGKKPAARKPAAKKTAARKPAAKKTAARKPAARKTAARKPAARKSAPKKPAAPKKGE